MAVLSVAFEVSLITSSKFCTYSKKYEFHLPLASGSTIAMDKICFESCFFWLSKISSPTRLSFDLVSSDSLS